MSNKTFGTELTPISQIFQDRLFTIPDYQRGYAWEKKQIDELLKDIDHLLNDDEALRHYTGTLVLNRNINAQNEEYYIVDGQQRLTTLIIFIKVLSDQLQEETERNELHELYLRRGSIGNQRPVLRLNSDTYRFFEKVIIGNETINSNPPTLEAHNRLFDVQKLIRKWLLDKISSGISVAVIRNILENKLGFLIYAPKQDAETGIMFEVINNRGKPLSELEKVKNYLIYCSVKLSAAVLRSDIDTSWSNILRMLNTAGKTTPSDEGGFLRYCVTVHFRLNKTDSQYGYEELKKRINIDKAMIDQAFKDEAVKKIADFVTFLDTAALWYSRLYGQQHKDLDIRLSAILNQIRAQEQHASIMPLFLALVINLQQIDRLIQLLMLLEILNFRVYMTRNMTARNDTGQGDLYSYASKYYHSQLLDNYAEEFPSLPLNQENALESLLVKFVLWYSSDERFKNSFTLEHDSPDDFYRWGGLRYFLMTYEATLQPNKTIQIDKILLSRKDGKSADYLSVEHLWALENRNQIGENTRKVDRFEKRRLGNFVLLELRLNIQGYKDNLEHKLKKYLEGLDNEPATDLEQVRRMARDAKKIFSKFENKTKSKNYYLSLYRELNKLQENHYINFAENRWSIKKFLNYKEHKKALLDENEG